VVVVSKCGFTFVERRVNNISFLLQFSKIIVLYNNHWYNGAGVGLRHYFCFINYLGGVDKVVLYHYFEKAKGPFLSLSALPLKEAQEILNNLVTEEKTFAAQRNERYLPRRHELERVVHELFVAKGGKPEKQTPHYFVVGECPWLATWYKQADYVKVPIEEFDLSTVSFTYGDTFPTFSPSVDDDLEYRRKVYTYEEILGIIEQYGLPQEKWNTPVFAQPSYVEAQVWSDNPVLKYMRK